MLTLHSTTACGFFSLLVVPDQFASFVCLLILHTVSYCTLCSAPTRGLDGHTHTHTHTHSLTCAEGAPLWNQNLLSSFGKGALKEINIRGGDFTHHQQRHAHTHTHTLTRDPTWRRVTNRLVFYFYWNTYGLLYSWQLQETYMQSAPATVRLKHAQCIKSKTRRKKRKRNSLPTQSTWHCWHTEKQR